MDKITKVIAIASSCVVLLPTIYFGATPSGRKTWNRWWHRVQTADDETNYETRKQVEDTCRAMISSYNSDKMVYDQYKTSDDKEKQSWAEQAKMRANKTASTYNNYILKNNYVWKNDVPSDIFMTLAYVE